MRPCCQCRAPIQNSAVNCPACGATQDIGPQVNPEGNPRDHSPPEDAQARGWSLIQAFSFLIDILGLGPFAAPVLLAAYFTTGGVIGYYIAGEVGAVVGVSAMIGLLCGAVVWSYSRR